MCMDLRTSQREILDSDELKIDTEVTKKVKTSAKKLLLLNESQKGYFEKLISDFNAAFQNMLVSARKRKALTSKLDKLYPAFHDFSIIKGFELCCACEKAIGLDVPEILWQMLMEKEFLRFLSTELSSSAFDSCDGGESSSCSNSRTLSSIECNAVRYAAGFVIRKLEQKYSKKKTKQPIEYTAMLKDMAGKMRTTQNHEKQPHPSCKWINSIDRGGLYHVQDIVYDLFITIECFVDKKLSEIFKDVGKGIECVQKDKLLWVVDEEEVRSLWNQVPSSIENESDHRNLLVEIVHLWVTTRGHSKAHKLKEEYKVKQKQSVKGKRSLRKELASN